MQNETAVDQVMDGQLRSERIDRLIASLAESQHGVVSRRDLARLGLGKGAADHRVACGRLMPIHRGVYAVGHRVLTVEGHWMAAVLASGPDAVLSHRSAAALWGLRPAASTRPEVTVHRNSRPRPGIELRRSPLPADEVTEVGGIPVTTVPRTLLDLAAVLSPRQAERAINEAEVQRLTDPLSLDDLVARYPRRGGVGTIRAILAAARVGSTVTRSDLEDRFLAFVDDAGLRRPEINASLWLGDRWVEVDALWRHARLVVELDGRATHSTAEAFERDRSRDRALHAAGWRVVRITWRQLHDETQGLVADMRVLLGR